MQEESMVIDPGNLLVSRPTFLENLYEEVSKKWKSRNILMKTKIKLLYKGFVSTHLLDWHKMLLMQARSSHIAQSEGNKFIRNFIHWN